MCPPWLGCRVRVSGLVFLLSPVLSPNLSPILAGVLRPPPWSRLSLVSGLVSQLVSGLGCCVCLPSLVLLLSPNLSPIWAGVLFSCLRSCLPTCLRCGMLCPPPLVSSFSCLLSCLPTYLRSGMLCPASLVLSCSCLRSCLPVCLSVQVPGLVFLLSLVLSPNLSLVWDAVSASLVLSCSCLRSGDALVCGLGCCVRLPSLVLLLSPIWAGVLRSLVSGLVSQQVSGSGMLCPPP